ncbi:MAG: acylphosphatase [Oligoflexales bacterium]
MKALEFIHHSYKFKGRVQGVGFRFTSVQIAKEHAVAGFVRNEPDGSVWLEVEGKRSEIEAFISKLKTQMSENIVSIEVSENKLKGFDEFVVER